METERFRQAVDIGLGRAILHLQQHSWKPHADAIEYVCLHNTAYDPQCEGSRAEYVYEIVRLTDDPQHFAEVTARGLLEAQDFWDTCHLFNLARLFAKAGDAQAREAMYEKFRRNDIKKEPLVVGCEQIVSLDGVNGLLFVMDRVGQWLEANPCPVEDDLLRVAKEELGTNVEQTAREAAGANPNIRRYMEAVDECRQIPQTRRTPEYRNWSYEELRERIITKDGDLPRYWLSGWGKHASDEALRKAATDLLKEDKGRRLVAYLHIFDKRPFPLHSQRLIQLAKEANEETATASRRALRHIQDGSIRALALDLIGEGQTDGDVVMLLIKNYADGDQRLIESALDKPASKDDFHWTAHRAVDVFEANPNAEALPAMLRVYERCPCSLCRNRAVEVLMERGTIPAWMVEECRHDSYEHIREAAIQYAERGC